MIAEAELYRAQDEELSQKVSLKNSIEAAMYKVPTFVKRSTYPPSDKICVIPGTPGFALDLGTQTRARARAHTHTHTRTIHTTHTQALGQARDRGDEEAQEQIENIRDWLEFDSDDAPLSEYHQRAEILQESFGVQIDAASS